MGNNRVLRVVRGRVARSLPDEAALERAVLGFLRAAGVDPDDADLRETPRLVAQAWAREFLNGYGRDPAEVLSDHIAVPKGQRHEMVVVANLKFRAICPHHLLPWVGTASIAYVPGRSLLGFGRLSSLLEILGHRLVLQEALARQVVDAIMKHVGARGAACVISAEQACLRLRGGTQRHAVTWAEAYTGVFQKDRSLRVAFVSRAGGAKK